MAPRDKILHFNTIARKAFRPPIGQKAVWLPNFTLTLLRTAHLPPNYASFLVPLNMNKLDIKDYLWNAYGVPVLSVRSYIQQQAVQQFKQLRKGATMRRWYRPKSIKRAIVEMGAREDGKGGTGGGPFVWPDELKDEDLEPWDKKTYDKAQEEQEVMYKQQFGELGQRFEQPGRTSLAEQARRLREGKDEWRPTWQEYPQRQ